jgi:hypothetical protein
MTGWLLAAESGLLKLEMPVKTEGETEAVEPFIS